MNIRDIKGRPKFESEQLLGYYLWKNKIRQAHFAKKIGINPSSLCQIISRKFTPKLVTALKIMMETKGNVTFYDLMKDKDREDIKLSETKHEVTIKNLSFNKKPTLKIGKKSGKIMLNTL